MRRLPWVSSILVVGLAAAAIAGGDTSASPQTAVAPSDPGPLHHRRRLPRVRQAGADRPAGRGAARPDRLDDRPLRRQVHVGPDRAAPRHGVDHGVRRRPLQHVVLARGRPGVDRAPRPGPPRQRRRRGHPARRRAQLSPVRVAGLGRADGRLQPASRCPARSGLREHREGPAPARRARRASSGSSGFAPGRTGSPRRSPAANSDRPPRCRCGPP